MCIHKFDRRTTDRAYDLIFLKNYKKILAVPGDVTSAIFELFSVVPLMEFTHQKFLKCCHLRNV